MTSSTAKTTELSDRREEQSELLLCGHGLAALAHIGVLHALHEHNLKLDRVTGLSTGALIAALHANGVAWSTILELFLNQHPERFHRQDWLDAAECAQKKCWQAIDMIPVARRFVEANSLSPCPALRIVSYDLQARRTVSFEGSNYDLAIALSAACSISGLARPVHLGDARLVDCAQRGCRVVASSEGKTFISRAVTLGDVPAGALTGVDQWLDRRHHVAHCAKEQHLPLKSHDSLMIETRVPVQSLCDCSCQQEAITKVVAAGYEAAVEALGKTQPVLLPAPSTSPA